MALSCAEVDGTYGDFRERHEASVWQRLNRVLGTLLVIAVWLGDNRRLMFDRTGQIGIVDRTSRKVETLDAFRPDGVRDLGRGGVSLPKDNRFIYFSVRMRQADIWLLSLP